MFEYRYATTAVTYMVTARTSRNKFPADIVEKQDVKLKVKRFTF